MSFPARVSQSTPIARGMTFEGRPFTVSHTRYTAPILGQGDEGFTIDIAAANGYPDEVHGFASKEDAMTFLTSSDEREYTEFDLAGNKRQGKRRGLGLPDGLVKQLSEDVAPQNPNQDAQLRDTLTRYGTAAAIAPNPSGMSPLAGPTAIGSRGVNDNPAIPVSDSLDTKNLSSLQVPDSVRQQIISEYEASLKGQPETEANANVEGTPVPEAEQENPVDSQVNSTDGGPAKNF